ncbi:MAG: hypothetical protein ABW061_22460 [Polyangiaceae bacterium]
MLDRRAGGFFDATDGAVGPEHYRQTAVTAAAIAALEARLPGDFLVYRCQTGRLHQASVRQARAAFREHEFGLDAFAIGCFLLTHPERLVGTALGIDSAGSEYSDASRHFTLTPYWSSYDLADGLGLGVYDSDRAPLLTGSASGLSAP